MCFKLFNLTEMGLLKDVATFETLQTWIAHNARVII